MILNIDPKVDYAFKHLLGREATRPILMDVIDSVLNPAPGHRIRQIDLLNPFNPKETPDDKLSVLDIKARDESGRQFNVEMQMSAVPAYDKRILYYAARLYHQQFHEGQVYRELQPTISISILDHVLFPLVADHHLRFQLLEAGHHFALSADLEFHILELPKFTKSAAELHSALDIWLYFLRHAEKMDMEAVPAALAQYPLALRALEELTMLGKTDVERERYEARRKWLLDHNTSIMDAHEKGHEKGHQEGRQEARVEATITIIHLCEHALHLPKTPVEQLAALPVENLFRLADDLQAQLLKQNGQ